jgi:hypothetical protein
LVLRFDPEDEILDFDRLGLSVYLRGQKLILPQKKGQKPFLFI